MIESAVLYRGYVNAAFGALSRTGHGPSTDTILIGELAPEGAEGPAFTYRSSDASSTGSTPSCARTAWAGSCPCT